MKDTVKPAAEIRAVAIIAELLSKKKRVVEIGVFTGSLSYYLLAIDETIDLWMVDPWLAAEDEAYLDTEDFHTTMTQEQHDLAMDKAKRNVAPFTGRYHILRMKSVDAATLFEDATLDCVFIDGDHSYEGCKADIAAWWPKVVRGGILSGHDYRDDMKFGVKQAVHEWIGDLELRLGDNFTWFVIKP